MSKQIQEDLQEVTKKILHVGGLVEEAIDRSLFALLERDAPSARAVIDGDSVIDDLELDVEEKCLDILALRQPMAVDLRYVTGILKINSDLERMGDLAVNIAERAEVLSSAQNLPFRPDVSLMAAVVKGMVRDGLDALVRRDENQALRVWERDDEADALYREIIGASIQYMTEHSERIGDVMHLLGALRNLERIADHATNIAEDIIFMVEGKIVRHHVMEMKKTRLTSRGRNGTARDPAPQVQPE